MSEVKKSTTLEQKFDAVAVMRRAVDKALRHKKALGQYAVVSRNGKIEKICYDSSEVKS